MFIFNVINCLVLCSMTMISKNVINCEESVPIIQIRNETTRSQGIYSSNFKRVYVNSTQWNSDMECSFIPG